MAPPRAATAGAELVRIAALILAAALMLSTGVQALAEGRPLDWLWDGYWIETFKPACTRDYPDGSQGPDGGWEFAPDSVLLYPPTTTPRLPDRRLPADYVVNGDRVDVTLHGAQEQHFRLTRIDDDHLHDEMGYTYRRCPKAVS